MISFSVSFVLLLCMVHFISFLLNAKHEKSLNVFIPILTQTSSNELYNNEQSFQKQSIFHSQIAKSFSMKYGLNINNMFLNDNDIKMETLFKENASVKYFFLDNSKIIEISNKTKLNLYSIDSKGNKLNVYKEWEFSPMMEDDYFMLGAVSSYDKITLCVVYKNKVRNVYKFYILDLNENKYNIYDVVDLKTSTPLTAFTISSKNNNGTFSIIYSCYNDNKNMFYVLKKNMITDIWNIHSYKHYNEQYYFFKASSIKFINDNNFILTTVEQYTHGLILQKCLLFSLNNIKEVKEMIVYQENENINVKSIQAKVYANTFINDGTLIEFINGKIYFINKEGGVYLLNEELNRKIEFITSDSNRNNIVIKYVNDMKLYFIRRESKHKEGDLYFIKKEINLTISDNNIKAMIIQENELRILTSEGYIHTFNLRKWYFNYELVQGIKYSLITVIFGICSCWYFMEKRKKKIEDQDYDTNITNNNRIHGNNSGRHIMHTC